MKTIIKILGIVVFLVALVSAFLFAPASHATVPDLRNDYQNITNTEHIHTINQSLHTLEGLVVAMSVDTNITSDEKNTLINHIVEVAVLIIAFEPSTEPEEYTFIQLATSLYDLANRSLTLIRQVSANTYMQPISNNSFSEYRDRVITSPVEIEAAIHSKVNAVRSEHNLSPVRWDDTMALSARFHSIDMRNNGYFSHTNLQGQKPTDRINGHERLYIASICVAVYGENLAFSYGDDYHDTIKKNTANRTYDITLDVDGITDHIIDLWMESKTHRDNMLTPTHTFSGVGVAIGAYNSRRAVYITHHFCS